MMHLTDRVLPAKPRECAECGGELQSRPIHSQGAVERSGYFKEKYRCNDCDEIGWIKGQLEDPPSQWRRRGVCGDDG